MASQMAPHSAQPLVDQKDDRKAVQKVGLRAFLKAVLWASPMVVLRAFRKAASMVFHLVALLAASMVVQKVSHLVALLAAPRVCAFLP